MRLAPASILATLTATIAGMLGPPALHAERGSTQTLRGEFVGVPDSRVRLDVDGRFVTIRYRGLPVPCDDGTSISLRRQPLGKTVRMSGNGRFEFDASRSPDDYGSQFFLMFKGRVFPDGSAKGYSFYLQEPNPPFEGPRCTTAGTPDWTAEERPHFP